MRKVSGFTIIELIVVIVILGILAAVALPRFFDLQAEARTAAAQGVAGAVASGAALNFGTRMAQGNLTGPATVVNACTTGVLQNLLTGGTWPAEIRVSASASPTLSAGMTNGQTGSCDFYHSAGGTTTVMSIIAVTS